MTARLTGWIAGLALVLRATAGLGQDVVHYYHLDAVGNILAVTDTSGTVVEQHDYLPFGEEWCGTQVCSSVTPGQPKRFTGKERDAETGLDYFGARYYGSKIARFTTTDPVYTWRENLVDPQRWNRYAYARNNPLRYTDPDGKAVIPAALIGGAIGGALGFGGSVFAQYVRTGSFAEINYVDARAAALGGAVSGALAGGTLGLSLLAEAGVGTVVVVGATSNAVGGTVARATDSSEATRPFDAKEVVIDASVGAAGGAAGTALQRSFVPQITQLERTAAGMQRAARAGNFGAGSGRRGIGEALRTTRTETEVGATVLGAQVTNQAAPIVREAIDKKRDNQ